MKFSIRDLLLVTVIVALALGWCVDRGQLSDEHEQMKKLLSWRTAERDALDFKNRDLSQNVRVLELALDEAHPGWRKYGWLSEPGKEWRIPFPPNLATPAPNPPKK